MKRFPLVGMSLLLCVGFAAGQTVEQKRATIKYLYSLQQDNGYIEALASPNATAIPNVRSTNAALRAIVYLGGELTRPPRVEYSLHKCFDKSTGGFVNDLSEGSRGKPTVASTSVAILALVELDAPLDPYADAVTKYLGEHAESFEDIRIAAAAFEGMKRRPPYADAWIEKVLKMRNPAGTWGKDDGIPRETGGAVALILRLGGKIENREAVLKAMKEGQRKDGAFGKAGAKGSDLETTYRITRSLHMLHEKPADVEALRGFIARCRNADGGYGVAPGQPSGASGTYFAAILLKWLAE